MLCAAAALAAGALAVSLSLVDRGWHPSALVRMDPREQMSLIARGEDPSFVYTPNGHYDGVYFYAVALDPMATKLPNFLIDSASYRYGHAGYGWLAALLSWGHAPAVPYALLAINVVAFPLAAYLASRLSDDFGWSAWGGLAIALNPGLIYALTVDTSEILSAALLAAGLLAWNRKRLVAAGVLFALLCLVKEVFVVVPAGIALWELLKHRRSEGFGERFALLVAVPFPLLLWWFYLFAAFGEWPFQAYPGEFTVPFGDWIDSIRGAAAFALESDVANQIGTFSVALLITVWGGLLAGAVRALGFRTYLDVVFLLLVILASLLPIFALVFPKDLVRNLALHLALLPALLATPKLRPELTQPGPDSNRKPAEASPTE